MLLLSGLSAYLVFMRSPALGGPGKLYLVSIFLIPTMNTNAKMIPRNSRITGNTL
jgi:hypothetical protein